MSKIWIERRKWPATPHYGHWGWVLGEDDHGLWIELRGDSPMGRGDEVLFHLTTRALMLIPSTGDWWAWFPELGELELYVDVVSGTQRSDASVTTVDLDLDVVRRRDGTVELLDEDEFAAHQVELEYPAELIEHAEQVAQLVLDAARSDAEPVDGTAARAWMAACGW